MPTALWKRMWFIIVLAAFFGGRMAGAQSVTLDAIDSGHYLNDGSHSSSNENYRMGCFTNGFFVFDVPGGGGITSATLRLFTGDVQNGGFAFFVDVDTPVDELRADATGRQDIFQDLRSGTELGKSPFLSFASGNIVIDIPLNANAVSLLNSVSGQVAIGGRFEPTTGFCGDVFGNTGSDSLRQLVLERSGQPQVDVTLTAPNAAATYRPNDTVTLEWTTTGANASDDMVLSMKRDSASALPAPDGVNWYRFPEATPTPNDGSEPVTIPRALAEADDWRFFVRHADSDVFDASDATFTYDIPDTPVESTLTVVVDPEEGGSVLVNFEDGSFAGINCPTLTCIGSFSVDTVLQLAAVQADGYEFSNWLGCEPDPGEQRLCNLVITEQKTVTAAFSPLPVVNDIAITYFSNPLSVGLTCDAHSPDTNTSITEYIWDFGDGNASTNTSSFVEHQYAEEGSYIVSCQVRDQRGLVSSPKTREVIVPDPELADTDKDGLPDFWEAEGLDINDDGTIDLDLPAMGADPMHKDIFVEVDYMDCANGGCTPGDTHTHRPLDQALQDVVSAFRNASVSNPDGASGINLHIFVDEAVPEIEPMRFTVDGPGANDDFNDLKLGNPRNACGISPSDGHFGSQLDRSSTNCENIIAARKLVFRYAIFGHNYLETPRSSGRAERPGNDFVITLGDWTFSGPNGFDQQDTEASTFMHELGHTLGLQHGGGDNFNCKPHYLSVMNYSYQTRYFESSRPLDYSSLHLGTIDEKHLRESVGITGPEEVNVVYGVGFTGIANTSDIYQGTLSPAAANQAINWDGDGSSSEVDVSADVNRIDIARSCDGEGEELVGFHDWNNLDFNFRDDPDFEDGIARSSPLPEPELTFDEVLDIARSHDSDGDGHSNLDDNCPADHNPGQTDSDGDGIGDVCDEDTGEDTDGDGIRDGVDLCPNSDIGEIVVIDGCNTGVGNIFYPSDSGCTISDEIWKCVGGAKNHGKFVSCVSKLTNELKKARIITGEEKGAIQSCAAQSSIP